MLRFFVIFFVLLLSLFAFQVSHFGREHFVLPFTSGLAYVSGAIMKWFDGTVATHGIIIANQQSGFAVSIEPGCNGVEALIILFSALFAFPATLKQKLIGFVVGFIAIQGLNLVRIISLFYIGQWSYTWFEWFHLYLWQAAIILDALIVWLLWLRWITRSKRRPGPPQGPDPVAAQAAA